MSQELNSDGRRFLGRVPLANPFGLAQSIRQRRNAERQLTFQTILSALDHTSSWMNSPPLKSVDLQGKVVLINFWTYTCITWIRSLPYVRAWAEKYHEKGLVVIGVHTPEFSFEHNIDNVRWAAKNLQVDYPIAIDNNYFIWRAFQNQYLPALYVVDARGRIGHLQFGEGDYELSEQKIQKLLTHAATQATKQEQGSFNPERIEDPADQNFLEQMIEQLSTPAVSGSVGQTMVSIIGQGVEAAADWRSLQSPENYVGYERTELFASPGGLKSDVMHKYQVPTRIEFNHWALYGSWTAKPQAIILDKANGCIKCRFHARDLHLIMGPAKPATTIKFRVKIDDLSPGAAHGIDTDEQGNGTVTRPRLYQLIRQQNPIKDRHFEIEFLDAGVEAFAFTFG